MKSKPIYIILCMYRNVVIHMMYNLLTQVTKLNLNIIDTEINTKRYLRVGGLTNIHDR